MARNNVAGDVIALFKGANHVRNVLPIGLVIGQVAARSDHEAPACGSVSHLSSAVYYVDDTRIQL